MFGNRPFLKVLSSIWQKRHYTALWNMYRSYPAFVEEFRRYLSGRGEYPHEIQITTPVGTISPTLYSHHDLLTANEVFCRLDYRADASVETVVDLGSNIGISALYFMTRNENTRCYLYEPDPRNVRKLKNNLSGFESRYSLREEAVSDEGGLFQFGIESTGRYGGIGIKADEYIEVKCASINEVLIEILTKEHTIDILKIDTEGAEVRSVKAIEGSLLELIGKIYLEAQPEEQLHSRIFEQRQYGGVCQLTNKALLADHGPSLWRGR